MHKKTKIVATLGPSSTSVKTLSAMLKNGMNVARINFSHGDHESNGKLIDAVRKASKMTRLPVAILLDLCGPKIRIGDFNTETVQLKKGHTFIITTENIIGTVDKVSVNYKKLPKEIAVGGTILLNDGKVNLLVESTTDTEVICTVLIGGVIRGRRGVNVPGAMLSISALTNKDKKDLKFGLSKGVHFVTLSFVRRAREITTLRTLLAKHNQAHVGIVAKIETQEAVENLTEIIAVSDAVMVARGDLASEIPRERVPLVQKKIIRMCNYAGKPVITATQMLDSMREHEVPTRAEVNDVANAILDGSDAVMLSDETTIGNHPALVIDTMSNIALVTEAEYNAKLARQLKRNEDAVVADSITNAIAQEASSLSVAAVVTLTERGTTARYIARHRISQPILVLTPLESTYYQSLLVYGCAPVLVPKISSLQQALKIAKSELKKANIAKSSDHFILGAGIPFGAPGSTNMMIVSSI